ncbi:tRNA pseudouridine(38-40) synthase TruA [Actinospica acidithermotolerans]|uniref:tRNA pseudouridine(38-40) synthase TruA n=1 Tax=Actinospica acidithermotolerans TaxID=2828514 RepID=UPI0020137F44|nr:tRNA pseudouridine(38-40) synthase TruA [Actinospica acidithermotolerans]
MSLIRVRLDLAYDGTEFAGWARQRSGVRTVQQVLEEALTAILRVAEPVALTVAGRTDSGVHASGQVAHFDLPEGVWSAHREKLLRRLAGKLPMDVRVYRAERAPAGFDARFAAVSRRYVYRVCDSREGTLPIRRGFVLWHNRALDVDLLNEASRLLLGEHDFAAYCKKREGATTIRRLLDVHWERTRPDEVEATVEADAFCHSMVRALVAALLMAGDGRCAPGFPAEVLFTKERHPSVNVLPPHGLTLEEVRYPTESELAARVTETRRMRTLGC